MRPKQQRFVDEFMIDRHCDLRGSEMTKGGKQEVKDADHDVPPRGAFILSNRPSGDRCPIVARAVTKFRPGVKGR